MRSLEMADRTRFARMTTEELRATFLVTGLFSRVDFRPVEAKQHRQFLRVEEGAYENGAFKFKRILNGDQTDWGLNFSDEPEVLRVSLATY